MENRQNPRVSLEHPCRVRFRLGGHPYTNIGVANLGPTGCCIQIPAQSVGGLRSRALLDGWEFINPGLPRTAIQAKVVWVQRAEPSKDGFIATGVEFLDAPVDYTRRLASYVKVVTPP